MDVDHNQLSSGKKLGRNVVAINRLPTDVTDTGSNLVAQDDLRSAACSPCSDKLELPEGTEELRRPAGIYAKLEYKGPYADMKDTYRWLYGVWLPKSGFEISERPASEAYLNSPVDTKPEDLRSDMFLPVESQS
ncbi:GyrI-like domain-containing protein [Roseovarius sp. Pro17]|uniref:AraC family transcriptional regulator n=1 Tax=Roseovarius sp. Pro17 TaxID=3108175 RepID=UPI002D77F1C2|nr:GyrI-like domain-containing protein [Roseovarius sp. Pro17]